MKDHLAETQNTNKVTVSSKNQKSKKNKSVVFDFRYVVLEMAKQT